MRRARGFVNYDVWLVATGLAMAAAIIVPAVYRGVRKAHLKRAEVTALQQIAAAERAHHDRYLAWLDSLPFALPDGTRLLSLRSDSAGWSASIAGDSGRRTQVMCGVFEGPAALAPDSAATEAGRISCW
ncbi:MAG TPA: hypothetical protein VEH62_08540 [Gemmatimonadales bacterium]|nr:hypothetical protein [Gemmatimonadales bacterium]